MTTGQRIAYFRKRAGMTMEELAKAIGVKNSAINKYEKGIVTNIPIERVKLMAAALDVQPEMILDFLSDDPVPSEITSEQLELLTKFSRLSETDQNTIKQMMDFMLSKY